MGGRTQGHAKNETRFGSGSFLPLAEARRAFSAAAGVVPRQQWSLDIFGNDAALIGAACAD